MNQRQRDFLVETIIKKANEHIYNLESKLRGLSPPKLSSYIIEAIQDGTAKLNSDAHIFEGTKSAALKKTSWGNSEDGENEKWMKLIYEQPSEFKIVYDRWQLESATLQVTIDDLKVKRDTLVMRVKLAPDKRLDVLMTEIDDMGDISLMDNKLLLISRQEQKQLT
jgi:hypothetical protein